MKRVLYPILAAATILAVSCAGTREENAVLEKEAPGKGLVEKTFKGTSGDVRSTLGEENKILFSNGEKILVFDEYDTREFEVKGSGNSVEITGSVQEDATGFYALTPYSEDIYFDYDEDYNYVAAMTLPQSQAAVKGTFADGLNIAAAVSDSQDRFSFRNLLSYAKLTIASGNLGGKKVKSVEISSSYALSGDVTVTFGDEITVAGGSKTVNSAGISLESGMGDGDYYIALLPNPGGEVTLKFTATDGSTATKTATLKEFKAGVIKNLGTVKGLQWTEPAYVLVETEPEDWSGDYVIVYTTNSSDGTGILFAGQSGTADTGASQADISIENKSISLADGSDHNVNIVKTTYGYSIQHTSSGKYLGFTGSKNALYFGSSSSAQTYQWNLSLAEDGHITVSNANNSSRVLQYNKSDKIFRCYTGSQEDVFLFRKSGSGGDSQAGTTVTTNPASGITTSKAVLNASFANASSTPSEAGFEWGPSADELNNELISSTLPSSTSGSFSATLDNLSDGITYWYRAYIIVWENGKAEYYYGDTRSFKVKSETSSGYEWFELPRMNLQEVTIDGNTYLTNSEHQNEEYYAYHLCAGGEKGPNGKTARNYTVCYSATYHCPLWVAAPRHSMYVGNSGRTDAYGQDGSIPSSIQYSSKSTGGGCNKGHMLGSAERTCSKETNQQVFHFTNIAPQLSTGFNTGSGGWNLLEDFIDDLQPTSQADTLYEVVGCLFGTVTDGYGYTVTSQTINFGGRNDVTMPAGFYYAVLKKKNSSTSGSVADCSASQLQCVAFVRAHTNSLKGQKPSKKELMSISDLEQMTGITFFTNVPNAPKDTYTASEWGL